MKLRNVLLIAICAVTLAGCGGSGMADLRNFVKTAYAHRKPKVEPVPTVKPAPKFAY